MRSDPPGSLLQVSLTMRRLGAAGNARWLPLRGADCRKIGPPQDSFKSHRDEL
jgi:hypothetical protein